MTIRKAEKKDIERILELLVQVCNIHSANRPDLFIKDTTKYTDKELEILLDNPYTPVFVAADDEDYVLGYCFGTFQSHNNVSNMPDMTTFYIDDLCVDEKMRSKGIGSSLYEYARNFAKEAGCYNLTLNVWDKNEPAIKFYEKCGFHVQKYCMEIIL